MPFASGSLLFSLLIILLLLWNICAMIRVSPDVLKIGERRREPAWRVVARGTRARNPIARMIAWDQV
jgi:hypothetical protein